MTNLLLCIAFNVGIFLTFRSFGLFRVRILPAIVINYFAATAVGLVFYGSVPTFSLAPPPTWLWIAAGLGAAFISVFGLMAYSSQKLGVGPTVTAAKLSMMVPIAFALLTIPGAVASFSWQQWLALPLSLLALALASYSPPRQGGPKSRWLGFLPALIFFSSGAIDSLLNYTNFTFLNPSIEAFFPIVIFASAAVLGAIALVAKKTIPSRKELIAGLALGLINYFSVYFLLATLSSWENNGAKVFPLNNLGIILGSSLLAVLLFREKITWLNLAGMLLAVLSLGLFLFGV